MFFICCLFAGLGGRVWGQELPFPYNIHVETMAGNCYDDSRAIITLWDASNNEILIDPATHNAVNINNYPLYNVEYFYRNLTAGTNTRYDTLNDIQLSAGTYCFGVVAYVPVTTGGTTTYEQVDTTLCNIVVPTHYNHLEASVLSGVADNNVNDRERCGIHCAFECADIGRIQLKLRFGNFPYRVEIYDEDNQLVRDQLFYQRQHDGNDSVYADFRDFYTFDSLPAGNYSIIASDSCGYAIHLSVNIPLVSINNYIVSIGNNCSDTNIVSFSRSISWSNNIYNYDIPFLDNLLQYRFINPGHDTTHWYSVHGNELYYNSGIFDTILSINRFCDLYEDTVVVQIWNLCRDAVYTIQYFFGTGSSMQSYRYDTGSEVLEPISGEGDTCVIHTYAGLVTQRYFIYGYNTWNAGYIYLYEPGVYSSFITPHIYTCPLSLDVYTEHDEQLLAHDEKQNFYQLVCSFTNPTNTDTSMLVHVVLTDAMGCVLQEFYLPYDFTISETIGDTPYEWEFFPEIYSCSRSIMLKEKEIDFYQFRHNVTVQLIESPLYNHFNFTATYHDSDSTWTVEMEDITNHTTNVSFYMGLGWSFLVTDPNLPTGLYRFVCTTECGVDTFTYVFPSSQFHESTCVFEEEPQFPGVQICDRYFVTPHSVCAEYRYRIDVNVSNDEPIEIMRNLTPSYTVVSGPVSGWYYSNNQIVFTLPGSYVIMTAAYGSCSQRIFHYDTVVYEPIYIDFDMGYAVICNAMTGTGNVLTHVINGTPPFQYYLYDNADLEGDILGTSEDGYFYNIPLSEGQQVSVLAVDSCRNSFYINLVVTPLSQSTLAWEGGSAPGAGHCEGDSVLLMVLPFTQSVTYHWTGPNGFESSERDNTLFLSYGSESGWYIVELSNTGCQTDFADSVYIEVFTAPTVEVLSDTTLCAGSEVELALVTHGAGDVHYTLHHNGVPQSGTVTLSSQEGDTLYRTFPIWGDNLFWATDVTDERCAYHHTIDTTRVLIHGVESNATEDVLTMDGYACYNYEAVLQAGSSLTPPYYVSWYSSPTQDTLLQRDTVWYSDLLAAFSIPNLLHDTMLYVAASNAARCANLYGTIYQSVIMNGGTLMLQGGEGVRFFDSGGETGNYSNDEQLTQTFCCMEREGLRLLFNSLNVLAGDTLFIYEGEETDPAHLLTAITNSLFPPELEINSSCVTFLLSSNWTNVGSGWSIDILTDVEMIEVYGYIIPPYYDTVAVEVCQSETPYELGQISGLDITTPGFFTYDTLFTADNGCDSLVHLDLTVHSDKHTEVDTTVCLSRLPLSWRGATFHESGTQTLYLQSSHGCDSVVTLTLNSIDDNLQITLLTEDPCADFSSDLLAETEMTHFHWSTGEFSPQITVSQPGTYFVTASEGNCSAVASIDVPVCDFFIYLPNAITPTDDNGVNDYFFVPLYSQKQIKDFEIIIYNRWGQMVFRSEDKNFRWHGDSQGKILANTSYTYVVNCTNYLGKKYVFKGVVTVL